MDTAPTDGSELQLWKVKVWPEPTGDESLQRTYYIAAEKQAEARAEAEARYRLEMKLLFTIIPLDPILIERLGKHTTRVTQGIRASWFRRLIGG